MTTAQLLDLAPDQLKLVRTILDQHAPGKTVWAYGSRASWKANETSDLDLVAFGCSFSEIANLRDAFEESDLLASVDVMDWETIPDDFKANIQRKYVVVQKGLPEGWQTVKLGDVAQINPTERLQIGTVAKKVNMDNLIPFTKKIPLFSNEEYKGGAKFRNGDTLVARITPCLENGKTSFVDLLSENEIGFGSTEFIVLRKTQEKTDEHFLYYLSRSPEFRNTAIGSMTGTSGRQRAETDEIRNYAFALPPLNEQKAIAEVLSSFDDKIDLLHRQNQTLENLAQVLFRKWFVADAKPDWQEKPLGEVVNIKYGKELPTKNLVRAGYPVFGANGQIGFYEKYHYESPQVLVSCRGEASGVVNISHPKSFITNNSLILEIPADSELTFEFLKYYALFTNFRNHTSGSAQPQITIEGLSLAPIVLPEKSEITKFSEFTADIEKKLLANQSQIRTLENLRDLLLPNLMNGTARVK